MSREVARVRFERAPDEWNESQAYFVVLEYAHAGGREFVGAVRPFWADGPSVREWQAVDRAGKPVGAPQRTRIEAAGFLR